MILSVLAVSAVISVACATDPNFQNVVLATHNQLRARHNVSTVEWDAVLATHAQDWANKCQWHHSDDIRPYNGDCGENISYGQDSISDAIAGWVSLEEGDYDFHAGESKNGKQVKHFTQVVWRKTTRVGCAKTYCDNMDSYFYVCNYYPSGNKRNAFTHNVYPGAQEQK